MKDIQVISYKGGEQVANVWDEGGRLIIFRISNDGNFLPFELVETAAAAALRDGHDPEGIKARFVEVVEQGGEPEPISVNIIL